MGLLKMDPIGFFTDHDGKTRPITGKRASHTTSRSKKLVLPHAKGRLDIVGCDPAKETVTVDVGGVKREYELKRHPGPYAAVAPSDPLKRNSAKAGEEKAQAPAPAPTPTTPSPAQAPTSQASAPNNEKGIRFKIHTYEWTDSEGYLRYGASLKVFKDGVDITEKAYESARFGSENDGVLTMDEWKAYKEAYEIAEKLGYKYNEGDDITEKAYQRVALRPKIEAAERRRAEMIDAIERGWSEEYDTMQPEFEKDDKPLAHSTAPARRYASGSRIDFMASSPSSKPPLPDRYVVTNGYAIKDKLKSKGFRFDPETKKWWIPSKDNREMVRQLVKEEGLQSNF